jgi:hypothetical protein
MRVLWLALLFAAAARAGVSGGASAKTSVKADVDVTWRTQDGVKNDNCTDLCIFSRDGQCDEPFLCPRGTDCDCDPEMSVTKGGVVVFNYSDVTKGAPKSLTEKYELRKSDRDKLYLGVIIVSSFMLLWLVLCASFCVNVEFIGDFALQIGLCVIFIGSIVFAAIFSGASKPFEGYGPMRKAREDLLFKPSLPLAGYCGLNFSAGYNATTREQFDDHINYLDFHEGITLITVVLFTSLILPEVGFARFKDPNEEKERGKRGGTELNAFCGALNPCAGAPNSVAGKVGNKAKARLSAAAAGQKDELVGKFEEMDLQGKALEAAGDEESELPGFYSSGVLGNIKKVKETLELIIQSIDQALTKMEEAAAQVEAAAATTTKNANDGNSAVNSETTEQAAKGTKEAIAKVKQVGEPISRCYTFMLVWGRLLLQGLQMFMDFSTNFLPVLTSAGQIVAFGFGIYAYYDKSIGGSENCNYLYLLSMIYFKPILLPWTKLVIASVRGSFKTDEPVPKTEFWDINKRTKDDLYLGINFKGFTYVPKAQTGETETTNNNTYFGTDCLQNCYTTKCNDVIIWTYNFFVTVLNTYNENSQRILGAISYGGHYMISIAIVMLMAMVPLLLVPIALYTSGLYEGEDYFVVTQWILWFLKDMWNADEMNFTMDIKVVCTPVVQIDHGPF